MITVGVDLSAETKKTCMATIEWTSGRAQVIDLVADVKDAQIVDASKAADKIGIDCPFGWPDRFVAFINQHQGGSVDAQVGVPIDWRGQLANRVTDIAVKQTIGLKPLSVAADRIAHAAFRCAALLAQMQATGVEVDRSGMTGAVVEVYPAASLYRWGLTHQRYKQRNAKDALAEILPALLADGSAPWLALGAWSELCLRNDDAFDSVIAALTARAACQRLVSVPDDSQMVSARSEGWIAIPERGSLPLLVQ